ncbi:MAG: hypothetical protein ACOX9E_01890 [Lentisphaeria bacterium]
MVAVGDDHCRQCISSHAAPDGVVMPVDHIGQTIAQMRQRLGGNGGHLHRGRQLVPQRHRDAQVMCAGRRLRRAREFRRQRQQPHPPAGHRLQFAQRRRRRQASLARVMRTHRPGLRRDKGPLQMKTRHCVVPTVRADRLGN